MRVSNRITPLFEKLVPGGPLGRQTYTTSTNTNTNTNINTNTNTNTHTNTDSVIV